MKLLLHVGMAKTGTSTLQATLHAHPKVLRRAGVFYPTPKFRKTNHNFLAVICQEESRYHREFLQRGATRGEARVQAEAFWADLQKQVGQHEHDTVILSGEYFFGMNPDEMTALGELLRGVFDDITIVAYVREPTAYYLSLIQQRVKGAAGLRPPSSFNMRARRLIPRLAEQLGGAVVVRPFDRDLLVGGDVVVDFLSVVLGLAESEIAHLDIEAKNTSMSAEAMCVMQLVRRHAFPDQEGQFTPASNAVMRRLDALRDEIPQTAPRLRSEIAAALSRSHQPDLAYLADQFDIRFPGAPEPLSPDEPAPAGWDSDDLLELLDIDRESVHRTMALLLADFGAAAPITR